MEKTAIFIRCTAEEADLIRKAADLERRTVSGYIINAVMNRIKLRIAPGISVLPVKKNGRSGISNRIHARRRRRAA